MEAKKSKLGVRIIIVSAIVLIGIIGLSSAKKSQSAYKLNTENILNQILNNESYTITPEEYQEIISGNDSNYQFIDLRNPKQFAKNHLQGAINIPREELFIKDHILPLKDTTKTYVLYYSDHCGACSIWVLLTQMGYKNLNILMGGIDYLDYKIANDSNKVYLGEYREEAPLFDFAEEMKNASNGEIELNETKIEAPIVPIKKKEVKKGGC